jgi:hypothetical protein
MFRSRFHPLKKKHDDVQSVQEMLPPTKPFEPYQGMSNKEGDSI